MRDGYAGQQNKQAKELFPHRLLQVSAAASCCASGQVFDTLMVGIFSDMSLAFSAIAMATLRAIAL